MLVIQIAPKLVRPINHERAKAYPRKRFCYFMPTSEKAQKAYEKLKNDASLFTPTLKKFVSQYTGLTMDTVIIYILFFALGIPNVVSYKYSTTRDVLE